MSAALTECVEELQQCGNRFFCHVVWKLRKSDF